MMEDHLYALIVAGGSGTRMGSAIPKQFLMLKQKPVLMHTIEAFHRYSSTLRIVLVLPAPQMDCWQQLCITHSFAIPHQVVAGGSSRTASVRSGLDVITSEGLVAIHDGVRPLVSQEMIDKSFRVAKEKGSGVVAMPLKDSVRRVLANGESVAENREVLRIIQTPQTFQLKLIKKAYAEIAKDKVLSDDASVAEESGYKINLVTGDYRNIKITTIEDLSIAEALLGKASDNNSELHC